MGAKKNGERYTFIRETKDLHGNVKTVTHQFDSSGMADEVLTEFLYFMQGCSYTWLRDLIMVKEGGQEVSITDYQEYLSETNSE